MLDDFPVPWAGTSEGTVIFDPSFDLFSSQRNEKLLMALCSVPCIYANVYSSPALGLLLGFRMRYLMCAAVDSFPFFPLFSLESVFDLANYFRPKHLRSFLFD